MNTLNLRTAITATDIDSDAKRVRHRPDDKTHFVRAALVAGRIFEPLSKPCECSTRRFRKNARRDFVLFRAFVMLAIAYGTNDSDASRVIAGECSRLWRNAKSVGKRTALHPSPITNAEHARRLWARRADKKAWADRAQLVEDRASVFAVLEGMVANDTELSSRRRESARLELCKNGVPF